MSLGGTHGFLFIKGMFLQLFFLFFGDVFNYEKYLVNLPIINQLNDVYDSLQNNTPPLF